MRPSVGLLGLLLLLAPSVFAQDDLPDLSTVTQPAGRETASSAEETAEETAEATSNARSSAAPTLSDFRVTNAPAASSTQSPTKSDSQPATELSAFRLTGLPSIAGVGVPNVGVPDTAAAPFMQKSNLPDGTVFICVGAALGFMGAAILAWRGLVAWSLHRSVKRAAMAQNLADLKAMSAVPAKKRGFYNAVGASSTMSLDRLSAAPTGTSKPPKPFSSSGNAGTPPKPPSASSLFFSPTAGGAAGLRDPNNRSSNYLPAGYYATGSSQPASGAPMTHVGGHAGHLSTHSLHTPGNRFSSRSGVSPPASPSLPPSRGYDRPPPSRDGTSLYHRNSVATLGNPNASNGGVYGGAQNASQLSLNVPGGSGVAGGRAPSAYLEDLFENHGNGPRERS